MKFLKMTALVLCAMTAMLCTACGTKQEGDTITWNSEEETLTDPTLSPEEIASAVADMTNPTAPAESAAETVMTDPAAPADPAEPAQTEAPAPAADAPAATTADPALNDPNAATVPADPVSKFGNAIWVGRTEDGEERYFFFYDEHNGNYLEQETGMGMGFTFDLAEDSAVFHIGAVDDNTKATISWTDDKHAYLVWETGVGESLTWLREDASAPFDFFSNAQLCEMALGYYEQKNNYRPGQAGAMINYDGKIAIQLYDNNGDHNSTCDWYTVDRYTAVGTNMLGETIDLKTAPLG